MYFDVDESGSKRLVLLRVIHKMGTPAYLFPELLEHEYGINLQTIQSVLQDLVERGHIEIGMTPNHNLTAEQRVKRDDEEDYYFISLSDSFGEYYKILEQTAAFHNADKETGKSQPTAFIPSNPVAPESLVKNTMVSNQQIKTGSNKTIANNSSKSVDNKICDVSLRLKGKVLRIYINNTPSEIVKRFKSKEANNITAYWELQHNKSRYLTKEQMKITKAKSDVKDIPKTMGISGLLADYFIDIDTKEQRLRIPKDIPMARGDFEILLDYVKRKNEQK